jgi:hypothetical protein
MGRVEFEKKTIISERTKSFRTTTSNPQNI